MFAFAGIERKNADWFEAHCEEMQPVTEARRIAMLNYKQNPRHPHLWKRAREGQYTTGHP